MVSENPPHHSRPDQQPVTIDLEAEEIARTAGSERMPDHGSDETAPTSAHPDTAPDAQDEPLTEQQSARATDAVAAAAEAAEQKDVPPAYTAPAVGTRQAPVSTLVAAGIVGGLIALAGVGAIRYAGFLPDRQAPAVEVKDNSADIASLNAQIDGLKQSLATLTLAQPPKPDDTLAARVSALETASKNRPAAVAVSGGSGAPDPAASQKIADLSAEIDQMRASLAQAAQNQAAVGADLGKRLDDAEKKLSEPRQDAAVARAIAAAALKAAIDRGGPFRPELDTFASVAPDDPAIADLSNYAQTGVPSRADLIRRVPQVASDIIAATAKPDDSQSWSDRLMSSAKSLVNVRPVGNVEGEGIGAIAARFEDKVKNGDLPAAVTEWNSLPDASKSASAAFKQSLDARIRVEDLVSDAVSKAIAGAGKQS